LFNSDTAPLIAFVSIFPIACGVLPTLAAALSASLDTLSNSLLKSEESHVIFILTSLFSAIFI
jgi:hypothetical protein